MFASKPLASLSSGLLARKGEARPAMRPQIQPRDAAAVEDDLGWNDLGEPAPVPPVLVERAALAREVTTPVLAPVAAEQAKPPGGRKAAFTLRLDADRHLRLRLAAAAAGRSAQQIVTEALDAHLSRQSGLDALVDGLSPSARSQEPIA